MPMITSPIANPEEAAGPLALMVEMEINGPGMMPKPSFPSTFLMLNVCVEMAALRFLFGMVGVYAHHVVEADCIREEELIS